MLVPTASTKSIAGDAGSSSDPTTSSDPLLSSEGQVSILDPGNFFTTLIYFNIVGILRVDDSTSGIEVLSSVHGVMHADLSATFERISAIDAADYLVD